MMSDYRPDNWSDEDEHLYQMVMLASDVIATSQQRIMMDEAEIQTLGSIWNMPSPGEGQ